MKSFFFIIWTVFSGHSQAEGEDGNYCALAQEAIPVQFKKYKVSSWIGRDKKLVKLAEEATKDDRIQDEINQLVIRFADGNEQASYGTTPLGHGYWELRGSYGGRVILKKINSNTVAIVGKSSKKGRNNEPDMFNRLRLIYTDFPDFHGDDRRQ